MNCAHSKLKLALAINLSLLCTALVHAQESTSQAGGDPANKTKAVADLSEIKVSSRQREERLQSVPISVTAFDAKMINNAGIKETKDFINLTPNVNLTQSNNSGFSLISIRGITQQRNEQSPLAVMVDGVPQVSSLQLTQQLYDIDQIEVLKGPQNALYGNNSLAGAINIDTKQPPSKGSEGFLQVGVGNGGLKNFKGSYGGSLTKDGSLRYQVAGYYSDFDGLINDTYLHKKADALRSKGLRLRVIDNVSDWITVDVHANYSRDHGDGFHWIYQPLFGYNNASNDSAPVTSNNLGTDLRTLSQLSVHVDFDYDLGTLSSISSWDRVREYTDGDGSPYSPGTTLNPYHGYSGEGTQFSYQDITGAYQEFRFTSDENNRFRWIAGVSAKLVEQYTSVGGGEDLGKGITEIRTYPKTSDRNNPTTSFSGDQYRYNTYAAFGQVAYDVLDDLEASAAVRYNYDDQSQRDKTPAEFSSDPGLVRKNSKGEWLPRYSLTWKPSDRLTAYLSEAKGYNSGGWNASGMTAAAQAAGIAGVKDKFAPTTSQSYEMGLKAHPVDWLAINADVFSTKVHNQHYYQFVSGVAASVISPIDRELLRGYEIEASAAITPSLSLDASYGYTDSNIRKDRNDPSAVGNSAPYVPRYTGNVSIQYEKDLWNDLKGMWRIDYRQLGPQHWDPDSYTTRRAVDLLGARFILSDAGGRWSTTIWGQNLLNKKYLSEYVSGGFVYPAMPRSFGVDFRFNFR